MLGADGTSGSFARRLTGAKSVQCSVEFSRSARGLCNGIDAVRSIHIDQAPGLPDSCNRLERPRTAVADRLHSCQDTRMPAAPLPLNELQRLKSLYELDVLDTDPEQEFDALVEAAALTCGVPISLISLKVAPA